MIRYCQGYKYQLDDSYVVQTAVKSDTFLPTHFIRLDIDGTLSVLEGYAWDGPSGPAIDTKNFMRGSLIHDALYQLMREGHLETARWRKIADEELRRLCIEDGMTSIRAWWVYQGVRFGGGPAAARAEKIVLTAP